MILQIGKQILINMDNVVSTLYTVSDRKLIVFDIHGESTTFSNIRFDEWDNKTILNQSPEVVDA
jgi:hypothetical protein